MQVRTNKKILGWIAAMMILTSSTLALACTLPHRHGHYKKYYNPDRVNTVAEARFDANHNGWLGQQERFRMAAYRVDTRREYFCDRNHNGYIDTNWERYCR